MELITIIIALNVIITLACYGIQAVGIKKQKYDSSLASWIIWSFIFLFTFVIYLAKDGWTTMAWFLAMQAVGHIVMIVVTYNHSTKIIDPEEKKLIYISVGGFIVWIASLAISHLCNINLIIPTVIGIGGQIIADAMGAIPYLKIIRSAPERQPVIAWILNFFIYPLTIIGTIVAHEPWTAYIFIVYAWILYGSMLVMLIIGQSKKRWIKRNWVKILVRSWSLPFFFGLWSIITLTSESPPRDILHHQSIYHRYLRRTSILDLHQYQSMALKSFQYQYTLHLIVHVQHRQNMRLRDMM